MEGTSRLIQFADEQSDQFLKTNDLKQLKSFLELMANYEDITPIIENNVRQLDGKILNAIDKKSISRFIRLVHKYLPQRAFYFLNRFRQVHPDNKEVIAFCHYYFGKNDAESNQSESVVNFTYALKIFTEINHSAGQELARTALMNLNK